MGKVIKCKFWCNAGHTEEEVEIEIDETENEESQIEKEVKYYDLAVARVFGQHCH